MARSSPCLGLSLFVALTAASAGTPALRFFTLRLDFPRHNPVLTLQQIAVLGESSAIRKLAETGFEEGNRIGTDKSASRQ